MLVTAALKYLGHGFESAAYTDSKNVYKQIPLNKGVSPKEIILHSEQLKSNIHVPKNVNVVWPKFYEHKGKLFSVTPLIKGRALKEIYKKKGLDTEKIKQITSNISEVEKANKLKKQRFDHGVGNWIIKDKKLYNIDPYSTQHLNKPNVTQKLMQAIREKSDATSSGVIKELKDMDKVKSFSRDPKFQRILKNYFKSNTFKNVLDFYKFVK